ncbi:isocitrate/isopropylmalate family dehydrogenase [Phycisphaerales bacterium AB-hyl4]|uniref:Isocitrate/isopropylmalate family dehydrogenase n=1 Tax=Natronomicrosphaera hydrolytica TaxID=3242702 RepID=A0ABV4U9G7_9BACT
MTVLRQTNTPDVAQALTAAIAGFAPAPQRRRPFVMGLLRGEGVGSEMIDATLDVLRVVTDRTGETFDLRNGGLIGYEAQRQFGQCLTQEVVDFCQATFAVGGAVLCGPGGGRFVYDLRQQFEMYCKLTPLRPFAALHDTGVLRPECVRGTDIIVVRENTGGFYFGDYGTQAQPNGERSAYQHCRYRETEVQRILEVAIQLAHQRSGRLAVITKPGGIPAISQLWKEKLHEMTASVDLETRVLEIDNAAYQLIAAPRDFDVVVCSNLFGDILGDCGSLLLASRGMSFSGNFGPGGRAVYQTGHGAAWDLAGSDTANPIGQISSLAMMLRESFGLTVVANTIEQAIQTTLARGMRTPDIAGPASQIVGTRELARQIATDLDDALVDLAP